MAGLAFAGVMATASVGQAFPSRSGQCSGCHDVSSAVAVTATQTTNDGTVATYNVSVSDAYGDGVTGWSVFSGTTNVANGYGPGIFSVGVGKTYKLWGVAGSGGRGSNSVTISPIAPPPAGDTTAPLVTITSPANASTVSGTVAVGASASDIGSGVNRVEFRVDGVLLASDTTSPYLAVWNADTAALGPHAIEATAFDNAGLSATSSVQVVSVASPPPPEGSISAIAASAPSVVAYSAKATVTGTLENADGIGILGKPVTLQSSADGAGWTDVESALTAADGSYTLYSAALKSARYLRVTFAGDAEFGASAGSAMLVKPKVRLTRSTSWTALDRNKTYYAKGYIEPYHSTSNSNKVKIRAYKKGSDGKYHYVKSFRASYVYSSSTKTAYKAPIRFTSLSSKGYWKLVAYHATDSTNYKTYGSPDYLRLR